MFKQHDVLTLYKKLYDTKDTNMGDVLKGEPESEYKIKELYIALWPLTPKIDMATLRHGNLVTGRHWCFLRIDTSGLPPL